MGVFNSRPTTATFSNADGPPLDLSPTSTSPLALDRFSSKRTTVGLIAHEYFQNAMKETRAQDEAKRQDPNHHELYLERIKLFQQVIHRSRVDSPLVYTMFQSLQRDYGFKFGVHLPDPRRTYDRTRSYKFDDLPYNPLNHAINLDPYAGLGAPMVLVTHFKEFKLTLDWETRYEDETTIHTRYTPLQHAIFYGCTNLVLAIHECLSIDQRNTPVCIRRYKDTPCPHTDPTFVHFITEIETHFSIAVKYWVNSDRQFGSWRFAKRPASLVCAILNAATQNHDFKLDTHVEGFSLTDYLSKLKFISMQFVGQKHNVLCTDPTPKETERKSIIDAFQQFQATLRAARRYVLQELSAETIAMPPVLQPIVFEFMTGVSL